MNKYPACQQDIQNYLPKIKDSFMMKLNLTSPKIGITALVPPEIIFASKCVPYDLNNIIPNSNITPRSKLCAWTAIWREMLLSGDISVNGLVVVAGGDCHNALVDGQKAASFTKVHYFFYPFDGEHSYLEKQMRLLAEFLTKKVKRSVKDKETNKKFDSSLNVLYPNNLNKIGNKIKKLKEELYALDKIRLEKCVCSSEVFRLLVSASDMQSNLLKMERELKKLKKYIHSKDKKEAHRIALVGVPPIYHDFHKVASSFGLEIVFDELPYEFIRHSGNSFSTLAKSYSKYTFAREIKYRLGFLEKELRKRKIDGIIHYTQFACHHVLEDEIIRKELSFPILTVQGDLPRKTPEQIKLRLEAFAEMLSKKG